MPSHTFKNESNKSINDCNKVNFGDKNGVSKTELYQKVLIQVYLYELHIDMLNKDATWFSMEYGQKGLFHISDSSPLSLPPQ